MKTQTTPEPEGETPFIESNALLAVIRENPEEAKANLNMFTDLQLATFHMQVMQLERLIAVQRNERKGLNRV